MLSVNFPMNHQKLLSIFRRVMSSPTAPFHEYLVRGTIEKLLRDCPGVTLSTDRYGNLIARYQRGSKSSPWVFGAHMDHPGFVRDPGGSDEWRFLGGVGPRYLELGAPRREFGAFAMWDLPEFVVADGRIQGRACDDLAGCAALVCLLVDLSSRGVEAAVDAVFTRAEEVGFLGALELAREWPFAEEAVFVSLETSAPAPGVAFGGGPVIRAGDAMSFFDHAASAAILRTGKEAGLPVQRALLDRGSCEATAMQHHGIRSAGISLLLGNYHNCAPEGVIAAEYIDLKDAKNLVRLLGAVIESGVSQADAWAVQERRFEERRRLHEPFWAASRDRFPPF